MPEEKAFDPVREHFRHSAYRWNDSRNTACHGLKSRVCIRFMRGDGQGKKIETRMNGLDVITERNDMEPPPGSVFRGARTKVCSIAGLVFTPNIGQMNLGMPGSRTILPENGIDENFRAFFRMNPAGISDQEGIVRQAERPAEGNPAGFIGPVAVRVDAAMDADDLVMRYCPVFHDLVCDMIRIRDDRGKMSEKNAMKRVPAVVIAGSDAVKEKQRDVEAADQTRKMYRIHCLCSEGNNGSRHRAGPAPAKNAAKPVHRGRIKPVKDGQIAAWKTAGSALICNQTIGRRGNQDRDSSVLKIRCKSQAKQFQA